MAPSLSWSLCFEFLFLWSCIKFHAYCRSECAGWTKSTVHCMNSSCCKRLVTTCMTRGELYVGCIQGGADGVSHQIISFRLSILSCTCSCNPSFIFDFLVIYLKPHGLSPPANYTDRATAACRRTDCQLLRIEGATWSAWRIPPAVFSRFSRREPLLFYQVAPQLYSRGWVDPVPDALLFFSGSFGNRTRASGFVAKNSDH
jgi:hypothetical protein